MCVPFVIVPHLAKSDCTRQLFCSLFIFTCTLLACGVRMSVKFPIASGASIVSSCSMYAVLPSSVMFVWLVSIVFVASTIGSISNATTHACFMLFHSLFLCI